MIYGISRAFFWAFRWVPAVRDWELDLRMAALLRRSAPTHETQPWVPKAPPPEPEGLDFIRFKQ